MKPTAYKPEPLDTTDVDLPDELRQLSRKLAEHAHDVWAAARVSEGWTYGAQRNDVQKEHPCLIPFDQMTEPEQVFDLRFADEILKAILVMGYRVTLNADESDE